MKKSLHLLLCCLYFYSVEAQMAHTTRVNQHQKISASHDLLRFASIIRAGSNIDVTYHRCYWRINPDSAAKGIKGSVLTKFTTIVNNVNSISFDMHSSLVLDSVCYRGSRLSTTNISRSGHVVTIQLGINLAQYISDSIIIFYRGSPPNPVGASIGYVKSSTAAAGNFIYTVSQPYEDKDWWPCKSDLTDKIDSIDIYINTPSAFKAASNGTLVSASVAGTNTTYFWKHRYPIATYLVCAGVAKYTILNSGTVNIGGTSMPVFHYVFQRSNYTALQSTLDLSKPMLISFSNLLGDYPYKNEKYGHYEHQSNAGGMEHATFSGMSAGALSDWKVIAHEIGHQWFGNRVTCASWNHIWLNEGFAQFMETLAAEQVPSLNANLPGIRSSIKTGARSISTLSPYLTNTTTTNDIFGANTGRYYQRGAVIVSMLRALMGDAKFFTGLKSYLYDPLLSYKTAVTDDLRLHLEAASGLSLSQFFNDWVYGSGNPNYSVQWTVNNKRIYFSMMQTRTAGASVSYFTMPVVLKISGGAKDTTIVIFDQAGSLSYAGGNFSPASSASQIYYDLSFTPTAVTFDPLNVTMATGVAGLMAALDISIKDFSLTTTATERKLDLFLTNPTSVDAVQLQKSYNGISFTDAGKMNRNNNTSGQYTYKEAASNAAKIYYRAKCNLNDGSEKYSSVIYWQELVKLNVTISPNPVADFLVIANWPDAWPKEINFQVFNLQGAKVWYRKAELVNHTIKLKFKKFPAGMYMIQARSLNNELLLNEKFLIGD